MTDPTLVERLLLAADDAESDYSVMIGSVRAALFREAAEELNSFQMTFDLRWEADMRAIRRWQQDHPGSELIWPDHADLVVWLMDQKRSIKPSSREPGPAVGPLE